MMRQILKRRGILFNELKIISKRVKV